MGKGSNPPALRARRGWHINKLAHRAEYESFATGKITCSIDLEMLNLANPSKISIVKEARAALKLKGTAND